MTIKDIKIKCKEIIIKKYPEYKQRNAALGLLSNEETGMMKLFIKTNTIFSNSLEKKLENNEDITDLFNNWN
jgi:hypothetical protein